MAMFHYHLLSVILKKATNSIYDITALPRQIQEYILFSAIPIARNYLATLYVD